MMNDEAAQAAIAKFHQFQMEGRPLVVNEARPKPEGEGGGGGRPPRFDRQDRGDRGDRDSGRGREPRW